MGTSVRCAFNFVDAACLALNSSPGSNDIGLPGENRGDIVSSGLNYFSLSELS